MRTFRPLFAMSIVAAVAASQLVNRTTAQPPPPLPTQQQSQLSSSSIVGNGESAASATQWVVYSDCPVMYENSIQVPAKETGLLETLAVELNASVKRGQLLANLEQEVANMELKIAKLQHAAAVEVANDDSQVQLLGLALKVAEADLESHSEIPKSVAANEMRKMKLAVARASLEVHNAERAMKRAAVQAELAAATVQATNLKLANRQMHAPFDGIVTEIITRPGQWVEAGKPLLVLSDMQNLQVDCLIPIEKIDLNRIVGLEVRVQSDKVGSGAAPVRLAGRITSYDPKLSGRGEVRVHCRIQNVRQDQDWLLKPNMVVRLEVAVPAPARDQPPALISKSPNGSVAPRK